MTHEHLVFGITIDQLDELSSLLRTTTANGDMVTICDAEAVHPQSVSTLGEGIFNAALAVRGILDQVNEQRLEREVASEVHP
jgi:hypothetical protein